MTNRKQSQQIAHTHILETQNCQLRMLATFVWRISLMPYQSMYKCRLNFLQQLNKFWSAYLQTDSNLCRKKNECHINAWVVRMCVCVCVYLFRTWIMCAGMRIDNHMYATQTYGLMVDERAQVRYDYIICSRVIAIGTILKCLTHKRQQNNLENVPTANGKSSGIRCKYFFHVHTQAYTHTYCSTQYNEWADNIHMTKIDYNSFFEREQWRNTWFDSRICTQYIHEHPD